MKHPLFLLTALAMLVASCTIDIDTNMRLRTDEATVFYATIEGTDTQTKVFADEDLRVLWNKNDEISIFNRTTGNQQFRFTGATGANAGSFNPVSGGLSSTAVDHIYALYPYDEATTLNADGVVSLTLPATQTYKENSFGIGANTMLSVSDNNQLMFRNIGGYLAFKFYGDNVKVKSITLRGNNHEKLAGPATVTMPVNGIPTLEMGKEATGNITLACETPVTLSTDENNPTLFWFVLPPTDFTEGITVTVIDDQGGIFVKSSAIPFSVTRSNLRRMGVMEVTPESQTPPDNEIWYTAIDGEVLVPEDVDAFGSATIVSNTYENGKGVISFDKNLTEINSYAFWGCERLATISLPETVTELEPMAFVRCLNLSSFTGAFATSDGRALVSGNTLLAFAPAGLTSYTIDESVEMIAGYTFAWISDLTKVILPAGLTEIGGNAFSESGLTSIHIPDQVTAIEAGAFFKCANLSAFSGKFATADGRALITDEGTFWGFAPAGLSTYSIPEGVTYLYPFTIGSDQLRSITLPESMLSIGWRGISACPNLTGITVKAADPPHAYAELFPSTNDCPIYVPAASVEAYKNADYWSAYAARIQTLQPNNEIWYTSTDESVVNPYKADVFGVNIISNTYQDGLGIIQFDGPVLGIGSMAFFRCNTLQTVRLPEGLETVGAFIFEECKNLTSITLPNTLTTLPQCAFESTGLTTIHIPESVVSISPLGVFSGCNDLASFTGKYVSDDGRSLIDGSTLLAIAPAGLDVYTIPCNVNRVPSTVMAMYSDLKTLIYPATVTTIGQIYKCTGLDSVVFEATTPPAIQIGGYFGGAPFRLFLSSDNCTIYVPAEAVEAYRAAEYWSDYAARIQPLDEVQPDNEIWYTSTDGNIIEPYQTGDFDANIVSNTYENGKGVIKFDRDLTRIGNYAFARCYTLQTMQLPASITYIGTQAFTYCHQLQSMHIPENVVTISYRCFSCCPNLSAFSGKFATADGRCLIRGNELMAFAPQGLTSYVIDDGVEIINFSVFEECSSLTDITLPDGLLELKAEAFDGCSGLTALTLPSSLERIGSYAFTYTGLSTINIPSNVTTIGMGAFARCSDLASFSGKFASADGRSLVVDNTLVAIAPSGLTQFTIPDGISAVASETFSYCQNLTSIVFPSSVSTINESAVNYCTGLTGITVQATTPPDCTFDMFPESNNCPIYVPASSVDAYKAAQYWSYYAERIQPLQPKNEIWYTSTDEMVVNPFDPEAFGINIVSNTYQNGKGVLVFDQPLTQLGFSAFQGCNNLLEITLPDGILSVDRYAFMSCTALQAFHSNLASDDGHCLIVNNTLVAFAPAGVTEYEIPGGIYTIQSDTFNGCKNLTSITIPEGVTELESECFFGCSGLGEIHFPQSLEIIGGHAFSGCVKLTAIQLPTSLTTIDDDAFMDCLRLQTIDIPNSVTSLGDGVFARCSSLQSYTGRYATNDHLALIDGTVFKAFALGSNVKEYTVPAGVKTIGAFAFSAAKLDSIFLPEGLEEVRWHSFNACSAKKLEFPSSLTLISGFNSLADCSYLTEFTFHSVNPPTLARAGMLDNTNNCPIYVPAGSVDAYKAAQYWSDYAERIQAIPE